MYRVGVREGAIIAAGATIPWAALILSLLVSGCAGSSDLNDAGVDGQHCPAVCSSDVECRDPCEECDKGCCRSFACEDDSDCFIGDEIEMACSVQPDPVAGCRLCEFAGPCDPGLCSDPGHPLFIPCSDDRIARCAGDLCECTEHCGGTCPEGSYCCWQTETCEVIPEPCPEVECPSGQQVNPEPGGSIDEQLCALVGADCSCVDEP